MMLEKFSYDEFKNTIAVPRETYERLQNYVELLKKWQKKINLVSNATLEEIWMRHIIDSAQLYSHLSPTDAVIDIGSGAGFPGLVMAIMGIKNMTLVESDIRKVAFLREAARATDTKITLIPQRAQTIDFKPFSTLTARAFASLANLIQTVEKTLNTSHKLLLLKGKKYDAEIKEAQASWSFDYTVNPSITDPEGVILSLHNFSPKGIL